MGFNRSRGLALIITLIILFVVTTLVLSSLENNALNQKTVSNDQEQLLAFTGAEAGILAEESKLNGQSLDLTTLPATINHQLQSNTVDSCQQHTAIISSRAVYGIASVQIRSGYFEAPYTQLPGCPSNISHQLWWQQVDIE